MKCRICKNGELKRLKTVTSPWNQKSYTLCECQICFSQSFDPHEHEFDPEKFYDEISDDFQKTLVEPPTSPYWQEEVRLISSLFTEPAGSVLDVGCRTGYFLSHWPESVNRVGVETSKQHAELARTKGLTVHADMIENIQFDQTFDVVTCYAVLEHIEDPGPLMDQLCQLVSPGGVFAMLIPSHETIKAKMYDAIHKRWFQYSPPGHLNFFSRKFLDGYFAENGLQLKVRKYTSGGMAWNPLKGLPFFEKVPPKLNWIADQSKVFNSWPGYDHMYCYYQRN